MSDTQSRIKSDDTRSRICQCPPCRGQGVVRGPQSNMPWFECRYCKGTGEVTEQQALDYGAES